LEGYYLKTESACYNDELRNIELLELQRRALRWQRPSGNRMLALALRVHGAGRMGVTTRWRLACRSPIEACRRFWWRGVWRLGNRSLAAWLRADSVRTTRAFATTINTRSRLPRFAPDAAEQRAASVLRRLTRAADSRRLV
jgi:hypothetical protein